MFCWNIFGVIFLIDLLLIFGGILFNFFGYFVNFLLDVFWFCEIFGIGDWYFFIFVYLEIGYILLL